MAWYGRSSRFIFDLFRRYNSKIPPPLPFIYRSYSNARIYHPTFSHYLNALKNSNSNSNSITAAADVSRNTLFSGSRIYPSSIFRRSHSHFSQPFFTFQEYESGISRFSHPIFKNLFFQNELKNSKMAPFEESLRNPQEYFPLNISRNLVSQNALKNKNNSYFIERLYKLWNQNNPRYRKSITIGLLGCGVAASVYLWNLETIPFTKRTHFVLLSTSIEKTLSQSIFELAAEIYEWKILPSHHHHSIRVQKIGQEIVRALHKGKKKEEQGKKKMGSPDLEEFDWEFIVVDDPADYVNAASSPGGKIVVSTGMLDYLKTDAEIAAIIGHEVGHAAARHFAEIMSGILWLMILMFYMPDCVKKMTDRFVWLPYSRRTEIEADYIGLVLMASAGYDPRVAVEVYEKFDRLNCSLPLDDEDHLSTHPSGKERAQLLSEPKVMEEALSLYREALKEKEKDGEGDHPMSFFNRINRCVCKVLDLFFKQR